MEWQSNPHPITSDKDRDSIRSQIIEAVSKVYDPEIPVNVYDLGLIYRIDIDVSGLVEIDMTLTAPGCPVAGSLPEQVRLMVEQVPAVREAVVNLVWEPPWTQDVLSDEVRLQLGIL